MPAAVLVQNNYTIDQGKTVPCNPTGPFLAANGALYLVLNQTGINGSVNMFKSTDGALTWNQVAVGPANAGRFCAAFDGVSTITVCFSSNNFGFFNFDLIDFDTATDTWGASYGNSGLEACQDVDVLFKRSDGSFILGYTGNPSQYKYGIFAAGVWTFAVLETNKSQPQIFNTQLLGAYNSTDGSTIFVMHFAAPGVVSPFEFLIQIVTLGGALGGFINLDDVTYPTVDIQSAPGQCVIDTTNNKFYFGCIGPNVGGVPALFFQTDLTPANPILTTLDSTTINPVSPGMVIVNSVLLATTFDQNDETIHQYTANIATPLGPFTQTISSDPALNALTYIAGSNIPSLAGGISATNGSSNTYSFLTNSAPIAPPIAPPVPLGPMVAGIPINGTFSLAWAGVKCNAYGRTKCVIVRDRRPLMRNSKRIVVTR